jgi:hypothetical protein
MDQKLLETYRKHRAAYPFTQTATGALKHARIELAEKPTPLFWQSGNGRAYGSDILYSTRTDEGDFSILADIIPDDDQRADFMGEVTDAQEHARHCDGCEQVESGRARFYTCSRPSREAILVTYTDMHNGARCAVWFEPENTAAESRRYYLANKYPKWYAQERSQWEARDDAKRLAGLLGSEWQYVGVRARAFIGNTLLGEAAVWGVDFDGQNFTYLDEVAREEGAQAIAEAIESLPAKIKACFDEGAQLEKIYDKLRAERPELKAWPLALREAEEKRKGSHAA